MAGQRTACAKAIILCGDLYGWAGSVLGLRSAIKTYHEDHRKSPARKRFEDFASNFDSQHGTERVAEPESSRDMQLGTRLVKLEVPRMRGYDWALGDPPDDADLYVNARIRGQDFDSPVIHDHDRFGFPRPYGSFTWIRSVPAGWRASTPVSSLTVQVKTGNRRLAGTDDDVYLRVNNRLRFDLEKRAYDDFERGDDDTYAVPLDVVTRAGLSVKDITMAQIEKSRDGLGGGWFLQSFAVRLNGRAVASKVVNRWLEDNHRTASASMTRDHRTSDIVPVWASLEEDDYLYGFDDDGDVNGSTATRPCRSATCLTGDHARGHGRQAALRPPEHAKRREGPVPPPDVDDRDHRAAPAAGRPHADADADAYAHAEQHARPRSRPSTRRRSPSRTRVPAPPARSPSARRVTRR